MMSRRLVAAVLLLAVFPAHTVLGRLSQDEILELQAVLEPAFPAAARQLQGNGATGGRYGAPLLPAGSYGSAVLTGAYATGRSLLQQAGTYSTGTYGMSVVQGGYNSRRGLIEYDPELELLGLSPLLEYAGQHQQHDLPGSDQDQAAAGLPDAGSSSGARHTRRQQLVVPVGQCYCRYDPSYNTFALAEDTCREALYQRCQAESGLPCSWLDSFYAPVSGPGYSMPHEADIKAFLYQDCTPHPPCACAGLSFDGTDPVAEAVACCRDLRVACKTPFSGIHCRKVEAFCADDKHKPVLAAWTQHALQQADCSGYSHTPYQLTTMQELLQIATAAAATEAAADPPEGFESALLAEAMRNIGHQSNYGFADSSAQHQHQLIVALSAVAAGSVLVAVAAVVLAMRREAAAARPITSRHQPTAANVYRSLVARAALRAPAPAACVGSKFSQPLAAAPMRRDGSSSSLSGLLPSSSGLAPQGSGDVREPLLGGHGLSRSMSNTSDVPTNGGTGASAQ